MRQFNQKRTRSLDFYKKLEEKTMEPKELIKARMPPRKKLEALIDLYSQPNAPKPDDKLFKKLDMTGVDAKGLNLKVLGAEALRSINWTGADLSGQKLQNLDLHGMKMYNAKIYGTDFMGSNLDKSNFQEAKIGLTSFKNVTAQGAAFDGVKFTKATNIKNAAFQGSTFGNVNMEPTKNDANLDRTHFNNTFVPPNKFAQMKKEQAEAMKNLISSAPVAADDYKCAPSVPSMGRKKQRQGYKLVA